MKPLLFFCAYVCYALVLDAQNFNEFSAVDNKALSIPTAETYSAASIAGYVQSNFKSGKEKLRAIYAWVTANINYDKDSMYPINWSMYPDEKIAATLRRKKGVCENYASLFTDLAVRSGFQSYVVSGYTRESGSINRSGHSWCAVNLDQEWYLCDPTWDAGSRGNTRYFLVKPVEFIETHMPFDPLWQLQEFPLTEHEFNHGYSNAKKDRVLFNFTDSAKAFFQMDSLAQLEASTKRIKLAGLESERQKNWVAYNQMKIAIIYGEKDMELYNSAVADLNKANTIFNNYVQYRNNRFIPFRTDAEINIMLGPVNGLIAAANKKLDQMGKTVENFQYDPGPVRDRLNKLKDRASEQQNFVKRYLATVLTDREKLFYK